VKTLAKHNEPTVKQLFRMLDESSNMPDADPSLPNLKGQVRRRSRLMRAMMELLHLHRQFMHLPVREVEEQIRKQGRFIKKAVELRK
jgi:polyhydroxyalkanoate synthesis regulator protein